MDRSLLEKSFDIQREKRVRAQNLILFLVFFSMATALRQNVFIVNIGPKLSNSVKLQKLYFETASKILYTISLYFFLIFLIAKFWRTRISVTQAEMSLLGIKNDNISINLSKNDTFNSTKLNNSSQMNLSTSLNNSNLISEDNNLRSFQGDYLQDFANQSQTSANNSNIQDALSYMTKNKDTSKYKSYYTGLFSNKNNQIEDDVFKNAMLVPISLNMTQVEKNRFILKTRKWICQTILKNVVQEIHQINSYFRQNGMFEYIIGQTSCATLSWFLSKKQSIPHVGNIRSLISFLDITSNQKYLLKRIEELSNDGSLTNYSHLNKEQNLSNDFPADSQILMHFFLTYLDIHYPRTVQSHINAFSKQFYFSIHSKESLEEAKRRKFAIIKKNSFFSLLFGKKLLQVEQSNDNFFLVLVFLSIYAKYQSDGFAGALDLGPNGINLTSILD